MSCPYCKREVKHRKPCKVFVEMQQKERLEADQRKVEDEKRKQEFINTSIDPAILRDEIQRLRRENEGLKQEISNLNQQITDLEKPYEEPYQYRCCKCGAQAGYDGYCGRCSPDY